jgi:hypothetical protein
MKFEKWTVALAALGLVSLASVAKAEEKASSVMTALASTTLSGYVDTSAQWNNGTGNGNLPPYRFGGASKADGFNLDVVQLRIEKPLDEAEWAAGYRVDLWAGPDANSLGTQSLWGNNSSASTSDFAVRQAYAALRVPVKNGIDLKMGVFDSIIGYESIESPNDPNYTRSYGHSIEPTTHTGLLASYRFTDMFSASVGVANTVGPQINDRAFIPTTPGAEPAAESYKTYMASVAVTAPDSMGSLAGSTLYGGFVNGFNNNSPNDYAASVDKPWNQTSYYVGATVATPVTGLRAGASFDYLDLHRVNDNTWSVAGYASYQATEKLSFHARGEFFKDKDITTDDANPDNAQGVLFKNLYGAHDAQVMALTATAQYDLWKNVISRLELRWDHSLTGDDLFGTADTGPNAAVGGPDLKNAWMIGVNVIYKF